MDVWIIENGEKAGPFHDFDIRRRIEDGELPGATPAWHDGLAAWTTLKDMPVFAREFDQRPATLEEPEPSAPPPPRTSPPPLPQRPVLIRRFWARWLDLYVFAAFWWLGMWAGGRDIHAALVSPWFFLLHYVPWFVIESVLLHRFGFTPGKWLLGLRVVNDDGSLLTLAQAVRRSIRVFFLGLGLGFPGLTLVCQLMAYYTGTRFGRTLWDNVAGHRVISTPLHPLRVTAYVYLLAAALFLQGLILAPHVYPQLIKAAEEFPGLRKLLEDTQPWQP